MMKKALTVAAVTVLAGTAYAQSTKTDAQTKPAQAAPAQTLNIGDKAPAINVETWVKGEPITGYESGRVYVVEFWATWCGPCIAQMPHLSQIARTYKDKGFDPLLRHLNKEGLKCRRLNSLLELDPKTAPPTEDANTKRVIELLGKTDRKSVV